MSDTLTDFLLARVDEAAAPSWELVPYDCPPGCCAPAGWVGHRCLICGEGVSYGGTVEAIEQSARQHAEQVHRRSRVLAECEAKRRIVGLYEGALLHGSDSAVSWLHAAIEALVQPHDDHPDYRAEWRP